MKKHTIFVFGLLAVLLALVLTGCPDTNGGDGGGGHGSDPVIAADLWGNYTISSTGVWANGITFRFADGDIMTIDATSIKGPGGAAFLSGLHTAGGGTTGGTDSGKSYVYLYAGTERIGYFVRDLWGGIPYVFLGSMAKDSSRSTQFGSEVTSGIVSTCNGQPIGGIARQQ